MMRSKKTPHKYLGTDNDKDYTCINCGLNQRFDPIFGKAYYYINYSYLSKEDKKKVNVCPAID